MDEFTRHVGILNSNFNKNFLKVYKNASVSKRRRLIPFIHTIYRRWYYATMVEGTPLSPANMFSSICGFHGVEQNTHAIPVVRTPTKLVGISATTLGYTVDEHPIMEDITHIMNYCNPYIDIHEMDALTEEQALDISLLLSIKDSYYAAFLFDIILRLGLIEKVPALYVNRLNPTAKYDEFTKQKPRDMLIQVINTTIQFSSYGLRTSLQMPTAPFTNEFILEILKNPMKTDDLIQMAFASIGVDITQIMNRDIFSEEFQDSEEYDEIDGLIHSMYVVGLALDKYLHTPFGYFLRLLNPLYVTPFEFEHEMTTFLDLPDDPAETFFSFYLPPELYRLTELGQALLGVAKSPSDNLYTVPFAQMKDAVFHDETTFELFLDMAGQVFPQLFESIALGIIYSFKVKASYKPTLWAHVKISENSSLHQLYSLIAELFGLRDNSEYSFFHDKTENLFAEYPSAKRSGRLRVARDDAETILTELNFEHMKHMVLTTYNQALPFTKDTPTKRFEIEFMGESEPNNDEDYPRVSRLSKALSVTVNKSE